MNDYQYYTNLINSNSEYSGDMVYGIASTTRGTYISYRHNRGTYYGVLFVDNEGKWNHVDFGTENIINFKNLFANERYAVCTYLHRLYIIIGTKIFDSYNFEKLTSHTHTFKVVADIWNNKVYIVCSKGHVYEISIDIDNLGFFRKTIKSKIIYNFHPSSIYYPEEGHTYSYHPVDLNINDFFIEGNKLFVMYRSFTDLLLLIINRNNTNEYSRREFMVHHVNNRVKVFDVSVKHFLDGKVRRGIDIVK